MVHKKYRDKHLLLFHFFLAVLSQIPSECWTQSLSMCVSTLISIVNYTPAPLLQCPASPPLSKVSIRRAQSSLHCSSLEPGGSTRRCVRGTEMWAELNNLSRPWVSTKKRHAADAMRAHLPVQIRLHMPSLIKTSVSVFYSFFPSGSAFIFHHLSFSG